MNKQHRLSAANELIKIISDCGREFFKHDGFVSYLMINNKNQVMFLDCYTKQSINTDPSNRHWDGFTSGGTLRRFVEDLRDFVIENKKLDVQYFRSTGSFRNPWGYGKNIIDVRNEAIRLGMAT